MPFVGRKVIGLWSYLAVALAILGTGLDALPTDLLVPPSAEQSASDESDTDGPADDAEGGTENSVSTIAHAREFDPHRKPEDAPLALFDAPVIPVVHRPAVRAAFPPIAAACRPDRLCKFRL